MASIIVFTGKDFYHRPRIKSVNLVNRKYYLALLNKPDFYRTNAVRARPSLPIRIQYIMVYTCIIKIISATVSSVQAKEKSYGESMFKRLFKFFESHAESSNFLLKLRVQVSLSNMYPLIIDFRAV